MRVFPIFGEHRDLTIAQTAVWNSADKGSNISLSSGDRIATHDATAAHNGVRLTGTHTSGKYMIQVARNSTDWQYVVFGADYDSDSNLNTNNEDLYGVYASGGSGVSLYSTGESTTPTHHSGNAEDFRNCTTTEFYIDLDNGKLWMGVDGVVTNGGDPAAGTNPFMTGLPLVNAYGFYMSNEKNGSAVEILSKTTIEPPAGYGAW